MFSEILKVKPQVDAASLNSMEQTLSNRFSRIAKKFGSGLKSALIGGGILAIADILITKLLNPLKDAEETIDRMLRKGDDLVTSAKQFDTTEGKLIKLQAIGQASGLDSDTLRTLLGKFQAQLEQARHDETDKNVSEADRQKNPTRAFIGEKDTGEAFSQFIQSLQKADKTSQVLIQNAVFGERLINKAADFLQTDFGAVSNKIGAQPAEFYTPGAKKLGALADKEDENKAKRDLADFGKKASLITDNMINQRDTAYQQQLNKENSDLQKYETTKSTALAISELTQKFDNFATTLLNVTLPALTKAIEGINTTLDYLKSKSTGFGDGLKKLLQSKPVRGIQAPGPGPKY